MMHGQQNIKK